MYMIFSNIKYTHCSLLSVQPYINSTTKFCVLSIDFDYMGAGPAKFNFIEQIEDLSRMAKKVNRQAQKEIILPFVGVDPRRPNIFDLIREYIEENLA